ncbi:M42 family metallopeptidase [Thermotoga sp. KOL6]|uniref:M42 family metallopeptidase n=1 Tax=Thermotoga sp. KOL6 TaxID=126741 RepID=UPI000C781AE9|nr:M42 family metallopeptidase [Thermotoga sp. KOL6]PLV59801.1 aminopeptidase [Thermotoga sp. KOL6]
MREMIKRLTEAFGPSGREEEVKRIILEELDGYIDGHREDGLGNLIVWKGSGDRKIILDAHIDEIGVAVTNIDEKGFLMVEPVGGMSPYIVLGKRIRFESGVIGVVGMEGETLDERQKNVKNLSFDNLFVDIGVNSREEAEKVCPIGSFGVYDSSFAEVNGKYISKAMDDRIGCAVIVEVFKRVKSSATLYGVFSVQEEIGIVGASVAGYNLQADEAIAIDVTDSADTPKAIKRHTMKLSEGPALKVKDRASISSRRILEKLIETAEKFNIKYQMEVLTFGGTNAIGYQRTREGIPAATLSIPTRYIHSPNEMVSPSDVESAVELLVRYLGE